MTRLAITPLVAGQASAPLACLGAPLSLWGGYDPEEGRVIDVTHPDCGRRLAGEIVAMREARGSSSASSTLVEAARLGTAPAAIILTRIDPILTIGSLVAADLYQVRIPIVLVESADWPELLAATNAVLDCEAGFLDLA
ncbi:aconitase X swivel domain-containing protein [Sphingopyxis panaciterrae]